MPRFLNPPAGETELKPAPPRFPFPDPFSFLADAFARLSKPSDPRLSIGMMPIDPVPFPTGRMPEVPGLLGQLNRFIRSGGTRGQVLPPGEEMIYAVDALPWYDPRVTNPRPLGLAGWTTVPIATPRMVQESLARASREALVAQHPTVAEEIFNRIVNARVPMTTFQETFPESNFNAWNAMVRRGPKTSEVYDILAGEESPWMQWVRLRQLYPESSPQHRLAQWTWSLEEPALRLLGQKAFPGSGERFVSGVTSPWQLDPRAVLEVETSGMPGVSLWELSGENPEREFMMRRLHELVAPEEADRLMMIWSAKQRLGDLWRFGFPEQFVGPPR